MNTASKVKETQVHFLHIIGALAVTMYKDLPMKSIKNWRNEKMVENGLIWVVTVAPSSWQISERWKLFTDIAHDIHNLTNLHILKKSHKKKYIIEESAHGVCT